MAREPWELTSSSLDVVLEAGGEPGGEPGKGPGKGSFKVSFSMGYRGGRASMGDAYRLLMSQLREKLESQSLAIVNEKWKQDTGRISGELVVRVAVDLRSLPKRSG